MFTERWKGKPSVIEGRANPCGLRIDYSGARGFAFLITLRSNQQFDSKLFTGFLSKVLSLDETERIILT